MVKNDEKHLHYIYEGVKVYDPRTNSYRSSTNPALMMADLLCRDIIKADIRTDKALDNPFWDKIEFLANFCDEKI